MVSKYTHGEINCPVCRIPFDTEKLTGSDKSISIFKIINTLGCKGLLDFISNNTLYIQSIREDRKKFEEVEVFSPLLYVYMIDIEKFRVITEVMSESETQAEKYFIESQVSSSRNRERRRIYEERREIENAAFLHRREERNNMIRRNRTSSANNLRELNNMILEEIDDYHNSR